MLDTRTYHLLSRYVAKTISPKELVELRTLVNLSDNEELSFVLYRLWDDYEIQEQPNKTLLHDLFDQIQKRTMYHAFRRKLDWFIRAAAIFLIPLLSILSAYLLNDKMQDTINECKEMIVQVEKGQKADLTLPDGTKIKLNSESTLTYDQYFGKEIRNVKLSGEAYFEVAKDSTKPFIVHTDLLDIEVLGTSFNVYSYEKENQIEMTLISGRIKVDTHTNPAHTVYLKPNEKVSFNKTSGHLVVEKTDNRFETAWLRGALVFRSEPIKHVISKLERRYGVTIHLSDPTIENDLFTGSFDSDNIVDVMKMLRTHYAFTYKIIGDKVYILSTMK